MSCCSIVELEIVYIKQKLWFRSWWIEQKAYWEKLGPTNQSIMMKCMHNMLLLLFGSPNPQWTIIKASEASYVGLLFDISWFGRENCYFLPILLFFDLGAKIVTFFGIAKVAIIARFARFSHAKIQDFLGTRFPKIVFHASVIESNISIDHLS